MHWQQAQREDVIDAEKPPPPPPKDWLDMNRMERLLAATTSTNTNDHAGLGGTTNIDEYRHSQPPPYFELVDDHDDIYEDHPTDTKVSGVVAGDPSNANMSTPGGGQQVDGTWINEQEKRLEQEAAEKKRQEEAAEQRRKDEDAEKTKLKEEQKRREETRRQEEAAEQRRKDEEAEKTRLEEVAAERKRLEEAAEKRRKDEEKRLEE